MSKTADVKIILEKIQKKLQSAAFTELAIVDKMNEANENAAMKQDNNTDFYDFITKLEKDPTVTIQTIAKKLRVAYLYINLDEPLPVLPLGESRQLSADGGGGGAAQTKPPPPVKPGGGSEVEPGGGGGSEERVAERAVGGGNGEGGGAGGAAAEAARVAAAEAEAARVAAAEEEARVAAPAAGGEGGGGPETARLEEEAARVAAAEEAARVAAAEEEARVAAAAGGEGGGGTEEKISSTPAVPQGTIKLLPKANGQVNIPEVKGNGQPVSLNDVSVSVESRQGSGAREVEPGEIDNVYKGPSTTFNIDSQLASNVPKTSERGQINPQLLNPMFSRGTSVKKRNQIINSTQKNKPNSNQRAITL